MKGDSSKKRLSFAYTVVLLWGVYNVGNQFATMEDNSVDHSQPVEKGKVENWGIPPPPDVLMMLLNSELTNPENILPLKLLLHEILLHSHAC